MWYAFENHYSSVIVLGLLCYYTGCYVTGQTKKQCIIYWRTKSRTYLSENKRSKVIISKPHPVMSHLVSSLSFSTVYMIVIHRSLWKL